MAEIIHARATPEGLRFRVWLTTDRYCTEAFPREQMRDWLLSESYGDPRHPRFRERALAEIGERLDRAAAWGTSATSGIRRAGRPSELTEPWETERCRVCRRFHHAFALAARGIRCGVCGEPGSDTAHSPPCAARAP